MLAFPGSSFNIFSAFCMSDIRCFIVIFYCLFAKSLYSYSRPFVVMKKFVLVLLAVLVACAPAPVVNDNTGAPLMEPTVETSEVVTQPPSPVVEETEVVMEEKVPPAPIENMDYEIAPYTQLGCEQMLTKEQFAEACGSDVSDLEVTAKVGTNNCYVNIKSISKMGYTAGIALTGFGSAEKAAAEFDRRLKVFKAGAFDTIAERWFNFPNPVVDSRELYFLRDQFIVKVTADNRLCPSEKVEEVARVVDMHLVK